MASVISGFKGTCRRQRKVLQPLQESASKERGFDKNMVNPSDEDLLLKEKQPKHNEKLKLSEKENAFQNVRRSKRIAVSVNTVKYAESLEVTKAAKSTTKSASKLKKTTNSKKGCSTSVKKTEQTKLNQAKLNFSPIAEKAEEECKSDESEKYAVNTSTNEITEDSGFEHTPRVCKKTDPAILHSSVSTNEDILTILTTDTPPLSYWRDLAEQRRIALEKALHENELLYDQLSVLEAENSQLKELVREAEHLAEVVKAIVE